MSFEASTAVTLFLVALGGCLQPAHQPPADAGLQRDAGAACSPGCGAGALCLDGGCVDRCTAIGQVRCDGGCTDLAVDDANCGACGSGCPLGAPCLGGICQPLRCPAAQAACGDAGACVDLESDSNNCGACGMRCLPGAACAQGQCPKFPCAPDLLLCVVPDAGPTCVASQTDPQNCGDCGRTCTTGTSCRSGLCLCDPPTDGCPSPAADGGLICTDFRTDSNNCGGCAVGCVACETCTDGACVPHPEIIFSPDLALPDFGPGPDGSGFEVLSITVGDVNGDGLPDLLFAGAEDWNGSVYLNASVGWALALPDGGYANPVYSVVPSLAPGTPSFVDIQARVESADLNGDGIDDVAVLFGATESYDDSGWGTLEILTGNTSGTLTETASWQSGQTVSVQNGDLALGIGDVNGDGFADVVVGAHTSMSTFINRGKAGGFASPVSFQVEGGPFYLDGLIHLGVADMNQDGLADLVIPSGVYLQLPDGGFGPLLAITGPGAVMYSSQAPTPGQLAEFLESASDQVGLLVSSQSGPQLVATSEPIFPDPSLRSLCSVDLNGDGLADVIALSGYYQLEACVRRGSSFDCTSTFEDCVQVGSFFSCNPTIGANIGTLIAARQADAGAVVASDRSVFLVTCPGLP